MQETHARCLPSSQHWSKYFEKSRPRSPEIHPNGLLAYATSRRLFAELEAGPRRSADPTSFAAGLQIDHTIQQDGQEFMKLLLDLLQRRYADADSRVRLALAVAVLQISSLQAGTSDWEY